MRPSHYNDREPDKIRGHVVVRKLASGTRLRGFFVAGPCFDPDTSEAEAMALWTRIASRRDGWELVGVLEDNRE